MKKKYIYIALSVVLLAIILVFVVNVRVGATIYYNVEATPKAYIYESEVEDFLIKAQNTYEEIYVNYKISYDQGDELTGSVLYCHYTWSGGELQHVKITTDQAGNNIVQYWQNVGAMGRLYYNGNYLNTAPGELQDYTLFLSVDDENARQSNLFYFYFISGIYYQNGVADGYANGYVEGEAAGVSAVQANPHNFSLYNSQDLTNARDIGFNQGKQAGINLVVQNPSDYHLYTEAEYNAAIQDAYDRGTNAVGLNNWIIALLNTIAAFLNIKVGNVSIGAIALIPLSISLVWFIIRQFRGGGGGD